MENNSLFIIMELVEGATLLDHITSHQEKGTFLTEDRIWHIFCQVRWRTGWVGGLWRNADPAFLARLS